MFTQSSGAKIADFQKKREKTLKKNLSPVFPNTTPPLISIDQIILERHKQRKEGDRNDVSRVSVHSSTKGKGKGTWCSTPYLDHNQPSSKQQGSETKRNQPSMLAKFISPHQGPYKIILEANGHLNTHQAVYVARAYPSYDRHRHQNHW